MTVVESVNGKSGVVKLEATDVKAIPESEAGKPEGVATLDSGGKLPESQLPSKAVSRKQLATEGSVLDILTFYPEDFGAKETGDSTKAFQEIIDYIVTNKIPCARIRLGPKYELNSTPRTDRQGNAIVALPQYGDTEAYIHFEGATGGTEITTTQEGLSYSSEHGCPSVIGGPTPEQLGITEGAGSHFSSAFIRMTDVRIITPNNPSISGIDLSRISHISINRVTTKGKNPESTEPTHKWAFGIRFPEGDNSGRLDIGEIVAEKYYVGIVGNSAHINAKSLQISLCVLALGITGNTQDGGNDGHSSIITALNTAHSKYHIGSWSPTEGVISLPTTTPAQVMILLWDIEDAVASNWYTTTTHLVDANSELHGFANYARVKANVGPVSGTLTITGGNSYRLTDMTVALFLSDSHQGIFGDGSDGEATLDGTTTVPWATKSGSEYTMTRNCYCTRLTIKPGVTLKPASFVLLATIKIQNEGTINGAGAAGAASGTPGSAGANGMFAGGTAGGAGTAGAGAAGANVTGGFGIGTGGAGGAGSSGAGGTAGTVVNAGITFVFRNVFPIMTGSVNFGGVVRNFAGASGGGGGGGSGAHSGGGGGAGGSLLVLFAPVIINSGTINVSGGAGGTPTEGNCGGGGGGGGGSIYVYTLIAWTAGTTNIAGGEKGGKVGTGEEGKAGAEGKLLNVIIK